MHILLIGGDHDYFLDMNTDTLIVVVVNRETKQVSLLSIPRDLWVYIPTFGWGRINIAFRIGARTKYPDGGGPGLLMRTIKENLGIQLDHWALVSYDGFARAVDELGGVDLVLPCPVNVRYQPPASEDEEEMILQPGLHHLDGATALRYVRTRRGDSDFQRAGRQQQFLKAVWHQFKGADVIPKIPALWVALKGAFATDLGLGDILALVPTALEIEPQRVRSRYIGYGQVEGYTTPEGYRVQLAIPEKVAQVIASLYAPPSADDRLVNEGVRVSVRNGTERHQLALIAADQLKWYGLQVVETGPADRLDYGRTRILVCGDHPKTLATLARLLKVRPEGIIHPPEPSQPTGTTEADLVVILGRDFNPCR